MQYLLLIYTAERGDAPPSDAMRAESHEYDQLTASLAEGGQLKGGQALQPTSAATTVQVRDGRTLTTDGPYAETKEALAGFYLIDVDDLDEAIETAARIPGARHGSIEVRPILVRPSMEAAVPSAAGG
jgi:hypothetical protein